PTRTHRRAKARRTLRIRRAPRHPRKRTLRPLTAEIDARHLQVARPRRASEARGARAVDDARLAHAQSRSGDGARDVLERRRIARIAPTDGVVVVSDLIVPASP